MLQLLSGLLTTLAKVIKNLLFSIALNMFPLVHDEAKSLVYTDFSCLNLAGGYQCLP